jgi:hypothetical protein
MCANSVQLKPGHTFAVFVQTSELVDRHHARIDWEWANHALERLDLIRHARILVETMPERVREFVPILR